jgi:CRP-like cAMP-binding protein
VASSRQSPFSANRILGALPSTELERLSADFEPITFRHPQLLQESGEQIEYVYFPLEGMLSVLTVLEDGEAIEAATVGFEGMAGVQTFLGAALSTSRLVTQANGHGLRMKADSFRYHLSYCEALRLVLGRYVDVLFTLFAQSAACNRLHPIEQRCARWLLMTHDRVVSDEFGLTQEFLSQMLGVRRASVSASAAGLQGAGLITYRHGRIRIVDRAGLEAASCECYGVIRQRFDQMLAG